jgi:hypothetical protein
MKKTLVVIFLVLLFVTSACNVPQTPMETPTPSEEQLATEISSILTSMPTNTSTPTLQTTPTYPPVTATSPAISTEVSEQIPSSTPSIIVTQTQPSISTPTPSSSPTPVITSSPMQTASSTPSTTDPKSQLGNPTWQDTLADVNNWPLGEDQFTRAEIKDGFLSLTALSELDGWRLAWPDIKDFYLEMTLKNGQCSGSDHTGMIVRVADKTNASQGYLYGITCDGRYSLRKWDGTKMNNLIKWTASPSIRVGTDGINRLGLMAIGSKLSLYVNGDFLTEILDESYTEGAFGMFIGSDHTNEFTVYLDEVAYWIK